ncbi:unnamed protein product [Amoebophrya sp. A120]|nr:unnamed protein product [Amoebophrya sp. A120]|eukprot:GSA120T00002155001.1
MDGELEGTVKSYNMASRYGFIENVPGLTQDVRFRRDDLPGQLYNEQKLVGCTLRFTLKHNNGGKYSAENIQDPTSVPTFRSFVKSWNAAKGFGFIECPPALDKLAGEKKDIFMASRHIIEVEHQGLDLMRQNVMFSVEKSPQGLSATFIRFPNIPTAMEQKMMLMQMPGMLMQTPAAMAPMVLPEAARPRAMTNPLKRHMEEEERKNVDYQKRRRGMLPRGRVNGLIASFVKGKYGFIRSEHLEAEIFFPAEEDMEWHKNEPVSFEIGLDEKSGKLRANDVSNVLVSGTNSMGSSPKEHMEHSTSGATTMYGGPPPPLVDSKPMSNPFMHNNHRSEHHMPEPHSSFFLQAKDSIAGCTLAELQELNVFMAQQLNIKMREAAQAAGASPSSVPHF